MHVRLELIPDEFRVTEDTTEIVEFEASVMPKPIDSAE